MHLGFEKEIHLERHLMKLKRLDFDLERLMGLLKQKGSVKVRLKAKHLG